MGNPVASLDGERERTVSDQPIYRLTLRVRNDPDGVPADTRLARVLKVLLRSFGFVCVRVEEIEPERAKGEAQDLSG